MRTFFVARQDFVARQPGSRRPSQPASHSRSRRVTGVGTKLLHLTNCLISSDPWPLNTPSPCKLTSPLYFTVLKGVLGVGKHGDIGISGSCFTQVHLRDKTKFCWMVAIVYDDRSLDLAPGAGQVALHTYIHAHTHSTAYTIEHSLLTAAHSSLPCIFVQYCTITA